MKLIIASNNAHKVYEIKKILSGKFDEILSLKEAGVAHETVEDGNTFMENSLKKAREIAEITNSAALADDSGICAHALGGAPGIYSARYAGDSIIHSKDEANYRLLLKNLADKTDRTAHFTCAMALVYPDGREVLAEGYMYGKIIDAPRGYGGFGYDPLFYFPQFGKTLAEVTPEEKNSVSHRGNAIKAFAEKLKALNINE